MKKRKISVIIIFLIVIFTMVLSYVQVNAADETEQASYTVTFTGKMSNSSYSGKAIAVVDGEVVKSTSAMEGEDLTFKIDISQIGPYYGIKEVVLDDGTQLQPNEAGEYTLEDISSDLTVSVYYEYIYRSITFGTDDHIRYYVNGTETTGEYLFAVDSDSIDFDIAVDEGYTVSNANFTSCRISTQDGIHYTAYDFLSTTNVKVTISSNEAVSPEFEGIGTKEDPYLLKDAGDMEKLASYVNGGICFIGKYFRLEDDITAPDGFSEIGVYGTSTIAARPFSGTFDGNGHTITMNIDNTAIGTGGTHALFKELSCAVIKNLTIAGDINVYSGAAGFVCNMKGSTLVNCCNEADVTVASGNAAGLVNTVSSSSIENCVNYGKISASKATVAGIADTISYSTVTGCKNYGSCRVEMTAGGIVANCGSHCHIENCTNYGEITGLNTSSTGSTGYRIAGIVGVIGLNGDKYSYVEKCVNEGTVSGLNYVGGIAGYTAYATVYGIDMPHKVELDIEECCNTGAVSGTEYVGGITGSSGGNIYDCYNTGTVTGSTGNKYVGGIAGHTENASQYYFNDSGNAVWVYPAMEDCFNYGMVTGTEGTTAGIVGAYMFKTSVENCYSRDTASSALYNLVTKSGTGTQAVATDISSVEFKTESEFKELAGQLDPEIFSDGKYYPVFKWQSSEDLFGHIVSVSEDTASVSIYGSELKSVLDENKTITVDTVCGDESVSRVDILISNDTLKAFVNTENNVGYVKLKTDIGELSLNRSVLERMLNEAGASDVTISLIKSDTNHFSVTACADGKAIVDEPGTGTIGITLPYTRAGANADVVVKVMQGDAYLDASYLNSSYQVIFEVSCLTGEAFSIVEESRPETDPSDIDADSNVWDGVSIDVSWYNTTDTEFYISTPAQLMGLAAIVNGIYNSDIINIVGNEAAIEATIVEGAADTSKNMSTSTYRYGADDFNGKTVYITSDMDMGGIYDEESGTWSGPNFMPIGGQYLMDKNESGTKISASFNGKLDGQGHTVSNIYCDRHCSTGNFGDGQSVGLVGRLGCHDGDSEELRAVNPAVRNIAVTGYIYANRSVGGIVGKIGKTAYNNGDEDGYAIIENCANYASVNNTDAKGVGGICGAGWNGGVIRNCFNAGNITSTYNCPAGGIVGSNEILLENCYNIGTVISASSSYSMAIGTNNGGAPYDYVKNCWYLEGCAAGGGYYSRTAVNSGALSSEYMQTEEFVSVLGSAFRRDTSGINGGYPLLAWQSQSYEGLLGDVNFNDKINIVDAQITYNIANGKYKDEEKYETMCLAADVNGDGGADVLDARAIQVYVHTGAFTE